MSSEPGPALELLGRIGYEANLMRPMIPTYIHLLVSAIFPIYIASYASLNRPSSAAKTPKKRKVSEEDDEENADGEEAQKIESLTPSDAIWFPLLAGGTLASLYFILKYLQDPAWLNWALGFYFSWVGLYFAYRFVKDFFVILRSFSFPLKYSAKGTLWTVDPPNHRYTSSTNQTTTSPLPAVLSHLPFSPNLNSLIWSLRSALYTKATLHLHLHRLLTIKTTITLLDPLALTLASLIVSYHTLISKPWFLTNFLGFSFCYGALQFTTPTTCSTGTLVLAALFFYDIYFVFFTPMMVTVATKLDVPIKLLFPRPDGCVLPVGAVEGSEAMIKYLECLAKKRTMAMLGLGDIVVPGMMIAFALRFDLYMHYLELSLQPKPTPTTTTKQSQKPKYNPATGNWGERFWTYTSLRDEKLRAKTFRKTYFYATIFGYVAGMVTTVVVMQVAEHAQPALLYLVPGVVGMFWGTALVRGELRPLWEYDEGAEVKEKEEKEGSKKKNERVEEQKEKSEGRINEVEVEEKENKSASDDKTVSKTTSKSKSKEVDPEDSCRKLIELTITLPDKNTSNTTSNSTDKDANGELSAPKKVRGARSKAKPIAQSGDDELDEDEAEAENESVVPAPRGRYNLRQSSIGAGAAEQEVAEEPVVKRRRKA